MSEDPLFDSLYNRTLKFLSFRPRSEKEILDYLSKKQASDKNKSIILNRLKEYKFIDDLQFAKWFIENRKKGKRLIEIELRQKGIDKQIINEAFEFFNLSKKENDLIDRLIEKKWKTVKNLPKEKSYQRLVGFLMRKGFDYDEVKKRISPLFRED